MGFEWTQGQMIPHMLPDFPKIITVGNHKGGVAKTTTTVNLADALGRLNKKILVVDADPQSNATGTLLKDLGQRDSFSLVKALKSNNIKLSQVACMTENDNVDIVPNLLSCFEWERTAINSIQGVLGLHRLIYGDDGIFKYDILLIDTPPNIGVMVNNAIMISRYIIIPIPVNDQYALDGFATFLNLISEVHNQNKTTEILGTLLTRFDSRATTSKKNLEKIRTFFSAKKLAPFKTIVRNNIDITKSQSKRMTIFEFDNKKPGAIDYLNLASEIIERIAKREKK